MDMLAANVRGVVYFNGLCSPDLRDPDANGSQYTDKPASQIKQAQQSKFHLIVIFDNKGIIIDNGVPDRLQYRSKERGHSCEEMVPFFIRTAHGHTQLSQ